MKKSLVLIPYWIHDALRRAPTATLRTALDFPSLRPLLALNDLVGMLTIQDFGKQVFGADIEGSLACVWSASCSNDQRELSDLLWETVVPMARSEALRKEITSRLFTEDARDSEHKEPFICYDLTPEVCGVVIYPGFFVGKDNTKELQLAFVREVLKVLYVYDTQSEVAKTSLFKRYLELLGTK